MTRRIAKRSVIAAIVIGSALVVASAPALAATIVIDPDDSGISHEDNISSFFSGLGVTLSAVGVADTNVYALDSSFAPTGARVFGWSDGSFDDHWARPSSPSFRADFTGFLAKEVSVDIEPFANAATLEAFGTSGSLGSVTTCCDTTLTFAAAGDEIEHIVLDFEDIGGEDRGLLDHLVITHEGPVIPLPPAVGMGLVVLGGMGVVRVSRRRRL